MDVASMSGRTVWEGVPSCSVYPFQHGGVGFPISALQ